MGDTKFVLCFLFCVYCNLALAENDALQKAWEQINSKNLNTAEQILKQQLITTPQNQEVKFLYARTLAWNGKHQQAMDLLNQLLLDSPKNTDYLFSKAHILSWQKKTGDAIKTLNQARIISPDYQALWEFQLKLLVQSKKPTNLQLAKQLNDEFYQKFGHRHLKAEEFKPPKQAIAEKQPVVAKKKKNKKKFIVASYHHQQLDNKTPDWKTYSLIVGNRLNKYSYTVFVDHEERFGLTDGMTGVNLSSKYQKFFINAGLALGFSQKLLPAWTTQLGAALPLKNQWSTDIQWQHKSFETITTDTTSFSLGKRWGKWEPKIRGFIVALNKNDITLSASLQLSYYISDFSLVRFSFTKGKELEYTDKKEAIYVIKSYSLDGKVYLNSSFSLIYALSHHIQGKAYKKDGILLGLQYNF